MEKLSEETLAKFAAVLTEVPVALRALSNDRDSWMAKAKEAEAKLEKIAERDRIVKIAMTMEEKHLDGDHTMDERIVALEKKAQAGKLDAMEEAIKMSPMNVDFGEVVDIPTTDGSSDLVNYLLGELG